MFKCRNCGLIFEFSIIRPYVKRAYKHMIEAGTLDPEAVKEGRIPGTVKVSFHPKYYHPMCPACGSKSDWWLLSEKR